MKTLKPKIYTVTLGTDKYFVRAVTKAGALKTAISHVKAKATVSVTTNDEAFGAGAYGFSIISELSGGAVSTEA